MSGISIFTNRQGDFAKFLINYNTLSLISTSNVFLGDLLDNNYFTSTSNNNRYQKNVISNDIVSDILSFNAVPLATPTTFKINTKTDSVVAGKVTYPHLNAIITNNSNVNNVNYVNYENLNNSSIYNNAIGINLINCLNSVNDTYINNIVNLAKAPASNTSPNIDLKSGGLNDILLGLYGWHDVLDSVNWQNFIQGNKVNVNNILYDNSDKPSPVNFVIYRDITNIDKNSNQWGNPLPKNLTANGSKYLWNAMNGIIPFGTILKYIENPDTYGYFDIYVMRRIIYGYISIINFGIASQIYSSQSLTAYSVTSPQDVLMQNIIKLLSSQNDKISYSNSALTQITTNSNDSLIIYNKQLTELKKITEKIQINKNIITDYQSEYSKNNAIVKKIILYEIVIAVILSITGIMSAIVIIFGDDMEYNTKKIISLTELFISVLAIIIIMVMYNKSFSIAAVNEAFQGTPPSAQNPATLQQSSTSITVNSAGINDMSTLRNASDRIMSYAGTFILEVNQFLALTDSINSTLKMNKIFGDLSYSTNVELDYYAGINEQLINSIDKLKSTINLIKLNAITHKYR